MKKVILAASIASLVMASGAMAADPVTATAVASWEATAKKDTRSALVITPLNALAFEYAEGLKEFRTQDGAFDITIAGESGATDFQLTSQIASNTLASLTNDSTLNIGAIFDGKKLKKDAAITMVHASQNINGGLTSVASGYMNNGRFSDQGSFIFFVDSATSNGTTAVEFKDLQDGKWVGDVKIAFNATWTK